MKRRPHAGDYRRDLTEASFSVLLEFFRITSPYAHALVLAGGWVPYLLLKDRGRLGFGRGPYGEGPYGGPLHIGSADIDVFVDINKLPLQAYARLEKLLNEGGYEKSTKKESQFRYYRSLDGLADPIEIELLREPPPKGGGSRRRHGRIEDGVVALNAEAVALGLRHTQAIRLEGRLPSGGDTQLEVNMLDVVGCLGTKGLALEGRKKPKDPYDTFMVARYWPNSETEISELLRAWLDGDPLLNRGLRAIAMRFGGPMTEGPVDVANFIHGTDRSPEWERTREAAFQSVSAVIRSLGLL